MTYSVESVKQSGLGAIDHEAEPTRFPDVVSVGRQVTDDEAGDARKHSTRIVKALTFPESDQQTGHGETSSSRSPGRVCL